jgi:hypothetical protein
MAVERRWSSPPFPGEGRVELVAKLGQFVGETAAPGAELVEFAVDGVHLSEQVIALHLQMEAGTPVEASLHAVDQHAVAEQLGEAVVARVEHRTPRRSHRIGGRP